MNFHLPVMVVGVSSGPHVRRHEVVRVNIAKVNIISVRMKGFYGFDSGGVGSVALAILEFWDWGILEFDYWTIWERMLWLRLRRKED